MDWLGPVPRVLPRLHLHRSASGYGTPPPLARHWDRSHRLWLNDGQLVPFLLPVLFGPDHCDWHWLWPHLLAGFVSRVAVVFYSHSSRHWNRGERIEYW